MTGQPRAIEAPFRLANPSLCWRSKALFHRRPVDTAGGWAPPFAAFGPPPPPSEHPPLMNVVVVESPASEARMREMFHAVDKVLRENPEVGAYNQTI